MKPLYKDTPEMRISLLIKILLIKTLCMIMATAAISIDMNVRVCGALVQFVCY